MLLQKRIIYVIFPIDCENSAKTSQSVSDSSDRSCIYLSLKKPAINSEWRTADDAVLILVIMSGQREREKETETYE